MKQAVSITVGATKKLQVPKAYKKSKLQWKSSKKAVVTVNKNGKIRGVAAGKADITAKTTGKKSKVVAKFKVKVVKKKSKVTASPAVVEDLQKFDEEYFRWHTTALIAVPITYGYDVSLDSVQEDGKNMTISLKAQNTVKDDQVVQTVMETKYILAELSHGLPNIEEISVQMTNYNNDGTVEKEKREICKTAVEARILPE